MISAIGGAPQVETALAWRFKAGDTLRYKIRYNVDTKIEDSGVVGPPAENVSHLDLTLSWSVTRVGEDGTVEIAQKVEHVREAGKERSPGGQRFVYDSGDSKTIDNAWSDLKSRIYRPIIGASYEVKMDRRGGVIDVRLPKDALKGWEALSIRPEEGRDLLFTRDGFKALLSEIPKLPSDSLPRRESWQNRQDVTDGSLQTTLVETYSPTGQQGPLATFEARPEIVLRLLPQTDREEGKPNQSTKLNSLISAIVEKQTGESKLAFDLAAGRVMTFSRRHRFELKYAFEGEVGSGTPRIVKVTTTLESDMNFVPILSVR